MRLLNIEIIVFNAEFSRRSKITNIAIEIATTAKQAAVKREVVRIRVVDDWRFAVATTSEHITSLLNGQRKDAHCLCLIDPFVAPYPAIG